MTDTITFCQDTCQITLYLPKLTEMPLKNYRKALNIMLSESWRNQEAINDLTAWFDQAVVDSKAAWHQASVDYQREWRIIDKPTRRRTKAEVRAAAKVKQHNEELTRACKRTKAQYERWVKYKSIWEEAQQ
jgi:SH3-like domain-containing protein